MYQKKKKFSVRLLAMILVLCLTLAGFSVKLGELQIVNAQLYLAQADTSSRRTAVVKAARGEILDRYGRPIAINREGFNLVFDAVYLPSSRLNETIDTLTRLLRKTGEAWADKLPLSAEKPYSFTEDAAAVNTMIGRLELNHYATAQNCFDAMVKRYKLQGYDPATQRVVMGVRYSMELADYSIATPYTFAEDVSVATTQIVEESSFALPGVNVEAAPFREYVSEDIAPHLIGTVGLLSAEDWQRVKDTGRYQLNDRIGKSGIEAAAEDYLKGTDGKTRIVQAVDGEILSSEVLQQPIPGNTVMLTLDKDLQRTAQDSLKRTIDEINKKELLATGGAVVVMGASNGEILAAATYPTYDMKTYREDYESLANDTVGQPLFNRAFNGTYAPGSTFKPAIAMIGLQTGNITPDETIRCVHRYTRFTGYQPTCMGWHGSLNVISALSKSCNYFFFELGYRIGIESMNTYCRQFGLGVPTGVEVVESSGILAGPEFSAKMNKIWNPGDTIQAAIGQSDNAFTPLQLAQYTATIASNGTRYQAHLIKEVRSYSLEETVNDDMVKVLNSADISPSVFSTVKEGMLSVTEDGTAAPTFANYKIKVGGKTGTAETSKERDNAVFIGFAPYDDPEITISIVIEGGGHGSSIAPLARDIFDAYFFSSEEAYAPAAANTLLP